MCQINIDVFQINPGSLSGICGPHLESILELEKKICVRYVSDMGKMFQIKGCVSDMFWIYRDKENMCQMCVRYKGICVRCVSDIY